MGFSSYDCKHCGHSILHAGSVDPEINEWMKDAVVLGADGSRLLLEFDGYPGETDEEVGDYGENVWVHQACWEVAGRPEFDTYDGPSDTAEDQGHFFGTEHDMIDPRISDEAERARLLAAGIEARERRWYDQRAREVADWLGADGSYASREPWQRYGLRQALRRDEAGQVSLDPNSWNVIDNLHAQEDGEMFVGTEAEARAEIAARWAAFVESDECRAYLDRAREMQNAARAAFLEERKAKGRYEVSRREVSGDVVTKEGGRDWTGRRTVYCVKDSMTYETVETFDGPNKVLGVQTFRDEYPEARVEAMRAAGRESARMAKEAAARLNELWAADGYPWDWSL